MAAEFHIRPMMEVDLEAVRTIQSANPEAADWPVADYLAHGALVALAGETVCGFLVYRQVAPDEQEILNLAVDPACKRQGVASTLLVRLPAGSTVYLEVRCSNDAARALYGRHGFSEAGRRPGYYRNPLEDGLVLVRRPATQA